VTVAAPPRPNRPDDRNDRPTVDALREQEALIEEARRRARRRRQRNAVVALLGATLAAAVLGFSHGGFSHGGGFHAKDAAGSSPTPGGGSATGDTNGKLAFVDGALVAVNPDGSEPDMIAHCQLSAHGCELAEPAWSPDGTQIAYLGGSVDLKPVPRGQRASCEVRHRRPDGRVERIHLRSCRRPQANLSLYLMQLDSGRVQRLAACGWCATQYMGVNVSWSPDGAWIAFSRDSGARGAASLWLVNTTSGELRRLTNCSPQHCADITPAWSPDGQLIVFNRMAHEGPALYTLRADGSQLTKLTDSAYYANPQWSPDGHRIAYDGDNKIFVIDADGSNQKLLLSGSAGNGPGVPSWSTDGTKLAYFNTPRESNGLFSAEVWTMNPDGSAKQRVYHSACCVDYWAAPIWSPDGTKLAFAANSAGGVFVVNPDGTGLRRLSSASTNALTWQRLP